MSFSPKLSSHTSSLMASSSENKRSLPTIWILGAILLVVRAVQLSQRSFYWDDLVIPARYATLSPSTIFELYDNHLMPGSVLVQTLVAKAAPLQWWIPAFIIIALTLASFITWAIALRALIPGRPIIQLLGLSLISFSPFLMDAAGWWSAALNAYAWQLTCAGVLILLVRNSSLGASAVLAAGLFFTEKALTILPIAVILLLLRDGVSSSKRKFYLPALIACVWLALYLPRVEFGTGENSTITGVPQALFQSLIPGALGGPWLWEHWVPSKAFADPNPVVCAFAAIVVAALLSYFFYRHPKYIWSLLPITGYLAILWSLMFTARGGANTSDMLLRSLHYYADWWTFVVLVVIVSIRSVSLESPQLRRLIIAYLSFFVASSILSTVTWVVAWQNDPAKQYLAQVRQAIANDPHGILDQQTPLEVLTPLMHPYNRVSSITGTLPVHATTHPQIFDSAGNLHPAEVLPISRSAIGSESDCGYRISTGETVDIPIEPGVQFGDWIWELNSLASDEDVTITITTPNPLEPLSATNSRAVTVATPPELLRQWVLIPGGGNKLRITAASTNPHASVCIGSGALGPLVLPQQD